MKGTARARRHPGPLWFADPRRWGGSIALIGSLVFVFSYAPTVGGSFATICAVIVVVLVVAAAFFLFLNRRWIGRFIEPSRGGILVYLMCVMGELALIAAGTKILDSRGAMELRPALIAMVVGIHFIPFAWAFKERMFYLLGSALTVIGLIGLLNGSAHGAALAAALSGIVMAAITLAYALGMFAKPLGNAVGSGAY